MEQQQQQQQQQQSEENSAHRFWKCILSTLRKRWFPKQGESGFDYLPETPVSWWRKLAQVPLFRSASFDISRLSRDAGTIHTK
jgi:hypothetical protein